MDSNPLSAISTRSLPLEYTGALAPADDPPFPGREPGVLPLDEEAFHRADPPPHLPLKTGYPLLTNGARIDSGVGSTHLSNLWDSRFSRTVPRRMTSNLAEEIDPQETRSWGACVYRFTTRPCTGGGIRTYSSRILSAAPLPLGYAGVGAG